MTKKKEEIEEQEYQEFDFFTFKTPIEKIFTSKYVIIEAKKRRVNKLLQDFRKENSHYEIFNINIGLMKEYSVDLRRIFIIMKNTKKVLTPGYCPKCGAKLLLDRQYCPKCGESRGA